MFRRSTTFDIELENIPLYSSREELVVYRRLLSSREFHDRFVWGGGSIETPFVTWHGDRSAFLSFLLGRAIGGVEAYVPHAVLFELDRNRRVTPALVEKILDPFGLGGKGTADNCYNRLPGLLSSEARLESSDPHLWQATKVLYAEVRNPLFHGFSVSTASHYGVLQALRHIVKLYKWIDGWHDPETAFPGIREVMPESFNFEDDA